MLLTSSVSDVKMPLGKTEDFACALPAGMLYSFQQIKKENFCYEIYCRASCLWGSDCRGPAVDMAKGYGFVGGLEVPLE